MAPIPGRSSWREIADLQSGVISERDAIAAGLTRADIGRLVADGTWRQPARGVLVTATDPAPAVQRAWAAVLAGGPGAVLGGSTAATLDGLSGHDEPDVTVVVPAGRRVASMAGVVIRRTARLRPDDVHAARLPPRTAPARTVIDMAEWAPDRDTAVSVVADALNQCFVTVDAVRAALSRRGPISRRTLVADALDELARRTPRLLARRYGQLEQTFDLPPGRALEAASPDTPSGRLDVWYGPWRLLVRVGMPGPRRVRPAGRLVLHVPAEQLWRAPAETARLVAAALREQTSAPEADPVTPDPAEPDPARQRATAPDPTGPHPTRPRATAPDQGSDEHFPADQVAGGGPPAAVASGQMRELPPWEAERAARHEPAPPTA